MDNIPNDLIPIIFDNIKLITDKRQFLKTCKTIYQITKHLMIQCQNNFKVEYFKEINDYSMEKFTLELCHDKYFNLIPLTYLNPNNTIIVSALATFGNVELLQIAVNNGCQLIESNVIDEYLHACEYSISKLVDTCALAAQNGHQNVIEFCLDNGCKLNWLSCLMAAKNGHLELLKWLHLNKCEFNINVSGIAAYYGHYDVVKWLIDNDCKVNQLTCASAAQNGHINILKLLTQHGCRLTKWVSKSAAFNGHLDTLKWLKENNCSFGNEICQYAAKNLNMLIWLTQNGYKLNCMTFTNAAEFGDLKIMSWLLENGCEWDAWDVYETTKYSGHIHIIEWLEEHDFKCNRNSICIHAAHKGYLHVLEWLKKNNYDWNEYNIRNIFRTKNTNSINWVKTNIKYKPKTKKIKTKT